MARSVSFFHSMPRYQGWLWDSGRQPRVFNWKKILHIWKRDSLQHPVNLTTPTWDDIPLGSPWQNLHELYIASIQISCWKAPDYDHITCAKAEGHGFLGIAMKSSSSANSSSDEFKSSCWQNGQPGFNECDERPKWTVVVTFFRVTQVGGLVCRLPAPSEMARKTMVMTQWTLVKELEYRRLKIVTYIYIYICMKLSCT